MSAALGSTLDRFIPERFRGRHRKHIESFGDTGATSRRMGALGALSGLRADGEEFPIEAAISHMQVGGAKLFTVILRDITERKKADERLARLAAIVDNSRDAIIGKTLDGLVTSWNAGAEALFGYTADEMIGRSINRIVPPESVPEEERFLSRLRAGEAVHRETVRVRKNGEQIAVSLTCSPIRNSAGEVVGGAKIARDITERKRAEDALQKTTEALTAASRAKDDFLAALSHELRTPLTPVLIPATELEADPSLSAEAREDLASIRQNVELEARLIDDLLDLTRITHGKLEMNPVITDVHALLEQTREILRGASRQKEIEPIFVFEADAHYVVADPTRLQQVFWNLLKNAIKFTDAKGQVTVRTANVQRGRIRISVVDSGMGISADALQRIFNAFDQGDLRARHRFGGLGLGLAISKAIVERHHGELRAASEGAGKGATFTVELTLSAVAPSNGNGSDEMPPQVASMCILVVEDHEPSRVSLERILVRDGHRVYPAGSVAEALATAAVERCDAVITDIGLPDGTGIELMQRIRKSHGWPGIVISGYGMEADVQKSREAGFAAHLTKPINSTQLRRALAALGASRR